MSTNLNLDIQHLVAANALLDDPPSPPPLHPAPVTLHRSSDTVPATVPSRPHTPPPSPANPNDLSFIPGNCRGLVNAILTGQRYILDKKRGDKEYWKCMLHKDGCKARIATEGRQLVTTIAPTHSHDVQHSEILVHTTKQYLKRKAVIFDAPTTDVVADCTDLLRDEFLV